MRGLAQVGTFEALDTSTFEGEVPRHWCQGRTVFGGLLATAAVRAMTTRVRPERRLRTVVVAFVGPVSAGRSRIEVSTLRDGSSMSFTSARLIQAGRVRTLVTAGFGQGRAHGLEIAPLGRPEAPPPDELAPMPYVPGLTPTFTQHFDLRWTAQVAPFTGADKPHVQGWVRPRDEGHLDAAGLLSLMDAWPPVVLTRATGAIPVSTVNWQVNFLSPIGPEGVAPDGWWFFDARCPAARDGYSDEHARLWGPDGRLVATSRQLVADFPAPLSP